MFRKPPISLPTTATVSPQPDPGIYVQAWAESFSQVLSQIGGTPLPCVAVAEAAGLPSAADNDVWIVCTGSGGLRGEMSFRIPAGSAVRLAQRFMSEAENSATEISLTEIPVTETPITPGHGEAVVEFFR